MTHADIETLAEFAEGRLPAERRAQLLAHLDTCADCLAELELANETIRDEGIATKPPVWRWLAVAAAVVIVLGGATALFLRSRSPESALVAAAPRSARAVEARLTGGFSWATYRGTARAEQTAADPERLRLDGAAADAIERGRRDASAPAQHAAGVALVLIDHPLEAADRLRSAARAAPNDARSWSDLAAAEYSAAQRLGRASLYPQALGDVEHALRLDPKLPEARFNRALILGRLGLADEERRAWNDYLALDASSPWATEARQHLARLSGDAAPPFERNRPRLEAAAAAGDATAVRTIVAQDPERARAFGEVEYLGRWGEALQRGDAASAAAALAVSRAIGEALVPLSGESLLRDAVRAIDAAADRGRLAEAHVVYRRGRITLSKGNPSAAEDDLRRAAALFAGGGDPLAYIARYYAAQVRFERHDFAAARQELDALAAELRARPEYIDAAAQVQWELALCRAAAGDWNGSLAAFDDAAARYQRLGERSNLAAMCGLRAWILDLLGRPEEAWAMRIDAFAAESRERRGDRLATALNWATGTEARAGHGEAARALLAIETRMHRAAGNDGQLVQALERETQLDVALGDDAAALAAAEEAGRAAARVADPARRERETAVAQLAAARAALHGDPARARALAAEAARVLEARGARIFLPDAALLRARAALRLGDPDDAAREIDAGIAALDILRVEVGARGVATGIDDPARQLFEEAVRLHAGRGDAARAFAYAERARVLDRSADADVRALQQRLAGSGTVVVEPFVLDDAVIVFAVDEHGVTAARHPIARADVESLVSRGDAAALYDALIRPAAATVAQARHLVVVPDQRVRNVPFAALRDGEHYLIERLPVSIAASASALTRVPARAPKSVVATALGDPADATLGALPESSAEVAEITRLYPRGETLPQATFAALRDAAARADVLHIAGHTVREAAGDAALLLGGRQRVPWSDIAAQPFVHAETVSLSACETLRQPARADAHALSLGGAFLAAGARYVVGTLTPIGDADARALFHAIHKQLAAGVEPAEAVRRAQLAEIAAHRDGWRAVGVMTNAIPF